MATSTMSESDDGPYEEIAPFDLYSRILNSTKASLADGPPGSEPDTNKWIVLHEAFIKLKGWALDIELEKTSVLKHVDIHNKRISSLYRTPC